MQLQIFNKKKAVGIMTALKQEAIHLVEQMPEEQIAHIIEYIYMH